MVGYAVWLKNNSPAVFQRILSSIICRRNLDAFCTTYINDIYVFSKTFEEHLTHLETLTQAILAERFRLKFIKCSFAVPTVQYLRYIISYNSVRPLNDNLAAIQKFPIPEMRQNVCMFLGKINFYHRFINNAATLLKPLHPLLRKDIPLYRSKECQSLFEHKKTLLTSSPILAIFDRSHSIIIYCDASGVGIGVVLKQQQEDGHQNTVAYFFKKLSESQRKCKAIYIDSQFKSQ